MWFLRQPSRNPYLDDGVPLPFEGTSQTLFAGRFTLRATTPGGRTASAPVTLDQGETTRVELDLGE